MSAFLPGPGAAFAHDADRVAFFDRPAAELSAALSDFAQQAVNYYSRERESEARDTRLRHEGYVD